MRVQKCILHLYCFLAIHISNAQQINVIQKPLKLDIINSKAEEVLPLLNNQRDILYFVRSFHSENIGGKLGGQDIWYSKKDSIGNWSNPINFNRLNTANNNVVVGISKNDSTLYLLNTYSNPLRWNYGISHTSKNPKGWSLPQEVPINFNSKGDLRGYYVCPHEDVILVSSNKEDSHGLEDIYIFFKKDDVWQVPIHLDHTINTDSAEISPFISEDHKLLFFASQGHQGLGNFDIFVSERLDDSWEKWTKPKNLGESINTKNFDGYFSYYDENTSFYTSSNAGNSTDILATKIAILPEGIKSDPLAHNEQLRQTFKTLLAQDTLAFYRAEDIVNATDDSQHNIKNVINGNKVFNKTLFEVNERDSLIYAYVTEQLQLSDSASDYKKRSLWNRALSEDIQDDLRRNSNIEKKLLTLDLTKTSLSPSASSYEKGIDSLRTLVAEKMTRATSLKQEITELVAHNALYKHNYTLSSDESAKNFSMEQIAINNQIIDKKLSEWEQGIGTINDQISELIAHVSGEKIYFNTDTKNSLSQNGVFASKLNNTLAMDSLLRNQIIQFEAEDPERFVAVDELINNNLLVNQGLLKAQVDDTTLAVNLLKQTGVDRQSKTYEKLNKSSQKIVDELAKIAIANLDISEKSHQIAVDSTDLLTYAISNQIIKEIDLKQKLSTLILERAQLRSNLAQSRDGGDSLLLVINNSELAIDKQIAEVQTTIEDLENKTLEAEKVLSPCVYTEHILSKNANAFEKLNSAITHDSQIMNEILKLENSPIVTDISTRTLALNVTVQQTTLANKAIDLQVFEALKNGGNLVGNVQPLIASNPLVIQSSDSIHQKTLDIVSEITASMKEEPKDELGAHNFYVKEIQPLVYENALLKAQLSEVMKETAEIRQKILETAYADTTLTNDIRKKTEEMNQLVSKWENNNEELEGQLVAYQNNHSLERRIKESLNQQQTLNSEVKNLIVVDSEALKELINQPEDSLSKNYAYNNQTQLNSLLQFVNSQSENINNNLQNKINSPSADTNGSTTIDMALEIDEYANSLDSIGQVMRLHANSEKTTTQLLLERIADQKHQIAMSLRKNSAFLLYLDTVDLSTVSEKVIESMEYNHRLAKKHTAEWKDKLLMLSETKQSVDSTTIVGYTVQILAMPNGMKPNQSYTSQLNSAKIHVNLGEDGLDRYYIGKYETKAEALKVMRTYREMGYEDAFVRPLLKYQSFGKHSANYNEFVGQIRVESLNN